MSVVLTFVYFGLVLFVMVYGLVIAGMSLDNFETKSSMERAVGFYSVFSVFLIFVMMIFSLVSNRQSFPVQQAVRFQ